MINVHDYYYYPKLKTKHTLTANMNNFNYQYDKNCSSFDFNTLTPNMNNFNKRKMSAKLLISIMFHLESISSQQE